MFALLDPTVQTTFHLLNVTKDSLATLVVTRLHLEMVNKVTSVRLSTSVKQEVDFPSRVLTTPGNLMKDKRSALIAKRGTFVRVERKNSVQ